jgi:hypothetical protein
MKPTTVLAIGLAAIELGLGFMTIVLADPGEGLGEAIVGVAALTLLVTFPLTGALLAARLPRNPIGWLLLMAGLGFSGSFIAESYAARALIAVPEYPGGIWAAWISRWIWAIWLTPLPLILLLLPNGRLLSPKWRPIPAAIVALIGFQAFVDAFRPSGLDPEEPVGFANPLGLEWVASIADLAKASGPLIGVAVFVAAASVIVRVRRARGVERQQLKWFGYAGGIVSLTVSVLLATEVLRPFVGAAIDDLGGLAWITFIVSLNAIPIAAVIAVLRYRLYDIDLLIKRTLVYAATSAALAITFFVGIVALQPALYSLTSGDELAVAASTLVAFALFQPIRRRLQQAVDRRFDRSRYDAARTLDAFADRLRDQVDLDALGSELLAAVGTTMAPAHASLWLREHAK